MKRTNQHVDTELDSRLGVPNTGALVNDENAGLLVHLVNPAGNMSFPTLPYNATQWADRDDGPSRRTSSCLSDFDAFIDDYLGIFGVGWGRDRG